MSLALSLQIDGRQEFPLIAVRANPNSRENHPSAWLKARDNPRDLASLDMSRTGKETGAQVVCDAIVETKN